MVTSLFHTTSEVSANEITGHVHENGLRYLIEKNALEKDSKGSYNPSKTVTRGEFAAYTARVLNLSGGGSIVFSDVPSDYRYAKDIQNAAAAGIITGYIDEGTFKPNNAISRLHMAIMLDRMMDHLKMKKSGGGAQAFKDVALIAPLYRGIVANGANMGIIHGDNGYFKPRNNATVAQAATFIQRLMLIAGDKDADYPSYTVKEISNGTLVGNATYSTFDAAERAMTKNTNVMVQNDQIMKMPAGFVVTNKYVALYSETVKDQIAVAGNTEMEYLGSDAQNVKVRLAGQVGYLKQADVTLVPYPLSKGRSYYMNEDGEIKHMLFNHATGKYSASYTYGKAPSFMRSGESYYSWNGINFTASNGTAAGEAYSYYQFLPARSKTVYSAQEINQYIMKKLAELERTGGAYYKDATKKSKLIGLGEPLKAIEAKYQINAMTILSLAQHESAYGMSPQAQDLNNLFGLYVNDTNPLNKNFESVAANINELIMKFWQPNYITPTGGYANGAVVGSKAFGFNVKYASDPFWGAKIAGHYYRADKEMGYKDAKNAYTIGLTTTSGLNVRTVSSTKNNTPLFTYKMSGMPVIVTSSQTNGWYEILSDKFYTGPAYISKDYVRVIQTIK